MTKKVPATKPKGGGPEYRAWLATVPEVERIRIADLLSRHKVTNYKDLGGFIQNIMVEVVRGNITPAVSCELRYWAELLYTVVCIEHTAAGTPGAATGDVIAALVAVARQPMPQPHYVQQERAILQGDVPDVLDLADLGESVGPETAINQ